MLGIERADYRRSRETDLLAGLRSRDPLALAEAYHRTGPAAHACARRLLGNARDVEALLHAVYAQLWASPPETARLEGWVRSRCFRLGTDHLRERDEAPASPSLALLLPDLPEPDQASHDPAEQALAALPEEDRRALLLAHDQGMPTTAQDDPDAAAALERALMALAGPGEGVGDGSAEGCADVVGMADWTLGLLEADRAAHVTAAVVDRPECAARSRALRRGRRRMEGLPAAPDLGQRVLASVLGGAGGPVGPAAGEHGTAASPPLSGAPAATHPLPTPASTLGDTLATAIPVAPLPSALDEEPPAAPAQDEVAERVEPSGPPAQVADPAVDDVAGMDEDERGLDATHGGDLDDAGAADDAAAEVDRSEPVAAPDEDVTAESPPSDHEPEPGDGAGRSGRGRTVVRQLLNALAIIVVLAAGAGVGLLIGFLLVGGR